MTFKERQNIAFAEVRKQLDAAGLSDSSATVAIVRSLELVAESVGQHSAEVDRLARNSKILLVVAGVLLAASAVSVSFTWSAQKDVSRTTDAAISRFAELATTSEASGQASSQNTRRIEERLSALEKANIAALQRGDTERIWELRYTFNGVPYAAPRGVTIANPDTLPKGDTPQPQSN